MRRYPNLKTIAFIGNYLPRKCGIATFTLVCLLSFLNMYSLDNITEIDLGLKIIESE